MTKPAFSFSALKPYARFILENNSLSVKLARQYLSEARAANVPLLRQLQHLSEEELQAVAEQSVRNFLDQVLHDNALEDIINTIEQWKKGDFLNIPRENIRINDLTKLYSIRKKILLSVLHQFSDNVHSFQLIVNELEEFYSIVQEYAFQTYVEIQHEVLHSEKEFISSIINSSIDGILAFDRDFCITELNPVMERWHGISKEEAVGRHAQEVFPAYKGSQPGFKLQDVLKGETIHLAEQPFLNRKGFYQSTVVPLKGAGGEISGGVFVIHETTRQKEAEILVQQQNQELATTLEELRAAQEQLAKSNESLEKKYKKSSSELAQSEQDLQSREEQLRLALDALPAYIAYIRKDYRYGIVNKAYENFFSKKKEEIIGKPIWETTGHAAFDNIREYIDRGLEGEKLSYEKFQDYGVGTMHTKVNIIPHKEQGEVAGLFLMAHDISEEKNIQARKEQLLQSLQKAHKEKEEALAEAELQRNRLHNLFMQTPALLAISRGPDLVYELANPSYLKVFGFTEEVEGRPLAEVAPDLGAFNMQILQNIQESGKRFVGNEFPITLDWKNNGKPFTRYFTIVLEPIHDSQGKTDGIITFGYEVSDQIAAREQLDELNKKLEKLNKELQKKNKDLLRINTDLDNFVYTASHDLKSPVANLQGLMTLLRPGLFPKADANEAKLLEMVDRSVMKLNLIIKDLVEITKVQRDMEEAAVEKVQLESVAEDVKADIARLITESGAEIREDFQVSKITYQRSSLRSILYNLLSNALKYRSPDRKLVIEISSREQNDEYVLCVKDNGLGMNPQQQKKLFTMFRRMHTHVEGTGIGLYTIKRIIENRGGRIEVVSEEGKGSEFTVYLSKNNESEA